MENWKIVAKDGNPTEEGVYDTILIHDDAYMENPNEQDASKQRWVKTKKTYAVQESRWYGEATKDDGWLMDGQPKEGLAWHEECGSYGGEWVYAWLPKKEHPNVELPEGVEWMD